MRVVELSTHELTEFASAGVAMAAVPTAATAGDFRIHIAGVEAGGTIGAHPALTWQLFVVMIGTCRVAGPDGDPVALEPGQGVLLEPGEVHQSWADTDVVALIVQSTEEPDVSGLDAPA